jgi:DNA-binding CsgD family transcriptional regulator
MRRYGMQRSHQTWLEGLLALSLLWLGRWDEADALLEAALLRGPHGITRRLIQLARAELALGRGDRATAAVAAADARAAVAGDQPFAAKLLAIEVRLEPDHPLPADIVDAWLYWHAGERERLLALPPATPEIAALQLEGAEAAAAWKTLGNPYLRARCLLDAARSERGTRRAAWLAEAHEIAAQLGAALPALAAKPALPYGLSARELEVLRLVERGYTNGQIAGELFISRKTASAHVSNILAKLGVARRAEAAAIAARLDG